MPDPVNVVNSTITSVIRLILAGIGGFFVRKGIVDNELWQSIVALLVSGSITVFWALFEKYHVKKTILVALDMPSTTTPAQLQTEVAATPVMPTVKGNA